MDNSEICQIVTNSYEGFVFFDLKKFNILFLFVITIAVKTAKTKEKNNDIASKLSDLMSRGKAYKSLPITMKYMK